MAKSGTTNCKPYEKLEQEFAKFVGKKYCVAVNTGTAALHLALVSCGIGKGDEVIVPDFCMGAAAFAVSYTGAKPVFVDCKEDLTIDEDRIEQAITKRTRAILPVHVYGRLCNMKKINELANKYVLSVIEDACEVHGARVGNADLTCFSFYKNKIVHGEEGGAICTNDERFYKKLQSLKNMSFGEDNPYDHADIGYNYRMTDSQANLVLESLSRVEKNIAHRKKVEGWYDKYVPKKYHMPKRKAVWVYDIKRPESYEFKPEDLALGIRPFFVPMTLTKPYKRDSINVMARDMAQQGIYLPVTETMTEEDVQKVVKYVII